MENYTVLVPPYTVGPEAYRSIPEYCRVYGTTAVVIGGKKAMAAGPLDADLEHYPYRVTEDMLVRAAEKLAS